MSQAITFKTEMKEKNEAEDGVDVEDNSSKQPKLNDFSKYRIFSKYLNLSLSRCLDRNLAQDLIVICNK